MNMKEEFITVLNRGKNFLLNLSTPQKVFLLIFIFNYSSQGDWYWVFVSYEDVIYPFDRRDNVFYGVNLLSTLGFFLFWKK